MDCRFSTVFSSVLHADCRFSTVFSSVLHLIFRAWTSFLRPASVPLASNARHQQSAQQECGSASRYLPSLEDLSDLSSRGKRLAPHRPAFPPGLPRGADAMHSLQPSTGVRIRDHSYFNCSGEAYHSGLRSVFPAAAMRWGVYICHSSAPFHHSL